jgi:hypothetical protein
MDTTLCGFTSFATDVGAFLGHRAFHQQHQWHKHDRHHGRQQKHIEISQRGCLLLEQILKCLQGQLLRGDWIAGLLQEQRPSLIEETNEGVSPPLGSVSVERDSLLRSVMSGIDHDGVKTERRCPIQFVSKLSLMHVAPPNTPNDCCGCAPSKGCAFKWVQVPPGDRSSREQPEQL